MLRIIVQSTENGSSEYVRIMEIDDDNLGESSDQYLHPEHTIDIDMVIDSPRLEDSAFPFNYDLKKE